MMRRKYIQEIVDSVPRGVARGAKTVASHLPMKYIHGRKYVETREFLERSQWWSERELRQYQREKLRNLINHAYENVPYYRRVFDEVGVDPSDIKSREDLSKLPYLTKEDITENFDDLIARNVSDTITSATSGSTGEPFKFVEPSHRDQVERAFTNRAFKSHGTDLYHEKTILLRSYSPGDDEPIYKYDPHLNFLYLSPFHISQDRIEQYADLIESYGADTIAAYPSSAHIFAMMLKETDLSIPSIDVVHTGSENLLPAWRDRIEAILNVDVKDEYGMEEKVGFFHQCNKSDYYHENLEYGVVEIIDREDGIGEVVGTSLWNYAMPLIRYRMGDKATVNEGETSCSCGRGLPLSVKNFEGRSDDILHTPDGRMIPSVNFYTLMYGFDGVDMFKMIQTGIDQVTVKLMVNDEFSESDERQLRDGLVQRLGETIDITIEYVDMISRDRESEKIRCVESQID